MNLRREINWVFVLGWEIYFKLLKFFTETSSRYLFDFLVKILFECVVCSVWCDLVFCVMVAWKVYCVIEEIFYSSLQLNIEMMVRKFVTICKFKFTFEAIKNFQKLKITSLN